MIGVARRNLAAGLQMDSETDRELSQIEREAELAVVLAVTNLPVESGFANSRTVVAAAIRQLGGSAAGVSTAELREQVNAAVARLKDIGLIDAPSDPSKRWRLTCGRPHM
jgi:hypothetical protein